MAATLSFYNENNIFASVPPMSTNAMLMMNDTGMMPFGSGQSLLSSFTDVSNFGSAWSDLYGPTSIFNSSIQASSIPLSESSVYTSDDHAADFLLMGSDSDFLNQINGVAAVMHPNLVSTLKNMVAPGPGSPRQSMSSSQLFCHSFFESQPSPGERLGTTLFQQACEQKAALQVEPPKLVDTGSISPICTSQAVKVEKSETDESIEAVVVSVDLIQNKRPFRCEHQGCNKTFKNPQTMKMHHKTHYSDGSAASKAGLLSLPTLSNSLKAGHNKKIPSRCPKCKKTFVGLYELRRHYGRKHSEGEKPFGCRKCGKKFYIEVDVRDHEKLCGEPIECKCGLKFAFKCNLVAHKKAHPACQDQQTSASALSPSSSTSASSCTHQSYSSSSDSDQSGLPPSTAASRGTRRQREDSLSMSPTSSSMHHHQHLHLPTSSAPLPEFKDIPEAPQFKCARYDFNSGGGGGPSTPQSQQQQQQQHPSLLRTTDVLPYYPTVPTFSHLPSNPLYPSPQQSQHFAFKMQQQQQGFSFPADMGLMFTNPSPSPLLQQQLQPHHGLVHL